MNPEHGPGGLSGRRGRREQLILAGKFVAGAVTFSITVVAFYITMIDRPAKPTADEWRAKAGAACERNFGKTQTSLHTALLQVAPLVQKPPPVGEQSPALTAVLNSIDQIAASFRSMSADIREIPLPEDHKKADVDALLAANQDVASTFSLIATTLVNYQIGQQVNAPELQKTTTAMQKLTTTTLPSWQASARRLGLAPCLDIIGTGVLGSSATPAPSPSPSLTPAPSPSGTGFTDQERALVAMLSTNVMIDCDPARDEETGDIVAAVNCTAARTGPSKRPLVMKFATKEAMQEWLSSRSRGLPDRGCGTGDSTGDWQHDKVDIGILTCKPGNDDNYLAMWTFTDHNIGVIAEAANRKTIWNWWTKNAYLVTEPTPSPTAFTAAQQSLVAKLKTSVLKSCDPRPDEEDDGVIAAVNCTATRTGPAKRPLVMQFSSVASLKTWLDNQSKDLPGIGCSRGDSARSWNHEGTAKGTLVCKPGNDDNYLAIWTFDAQAIAVIAEAADRKTIRDWWGDNANLLIG
ncbi:hypothetical protein ABGB17_04740 [Sphaerisporangium sp. B11E5]|uniref:hypothetical protein n=1 Tax=Sphaerisporangium sp. B11E5 TaxID=3153563 RepID=UPI00325C508F